MFGFLKDKLKKAVGIFSKKVEEEAKEEPPEQAREEIKKEERAGHEHKEKAQEKKEAQVARKEHTEPRKEIAEKKHAEARPEKPKAVPEAVHVKEERTRETPAEPAAAHEPEVSKPADIPEKKGLFSKIFRKKEPEKAIEPVQVLQEEKDTEKVQAAEKPSAPHKEEKKAEAAEEERTFLGKISDSFTKLTLSDEKFEELFWELELAMLENNVAVEVIDKIKQDLKRELVEKKLPKKNLDEIISRTLRNSIEELFDAEKVDIIGLAKHKKPYIIAFIGINGSGKTTTLAKFIKMLRENKLSVVVGACDTFRAAAIQQLEEHTTKLGVKLIKHDYGADSAAVAFDTVEHAKAKNIDVVLLDTGGRQHSNKNLMDELKKLIRVVKPDMKIFVGESITGNDCVEQVKMFNQEIGIDGIILSKADIDEKGGAAVSVSYVTKKPILFLGTGQNYDDLEEFNREKILEKIGLA